MFPWEDSPILSKPVCHPTLRHAWEFANKNRSSVQRPEKGDQSVKMSRRRAIWVGLGNFRQTIPFGIRCQSVPASCNRQQSVILMNISTSSVVLTGQVGEAILKILCPLAGLSKGPNNNVPTLLFQEKPKSTFPSNCSHRLLVVPSPECSNLPALT